MKITDAQYREAAKRMYHVEGETEIDDGARISADPETRKEAETGGVYVQAWVWVSNGDIEPHVKIPHGLCLICGHYGDDCTGKKRKAA